MDHITSPDGTQIAYERSGSGPSVVVVSSALADHRDAKRLVRRLSERFTVFNFDRRGRGDSGDNTKGGRPREVDDLAALIEAAGGSAMVFGSSSGAVLALEAANALGPKIPRLALFEPPFIVDNSRPPVAAEDIRRIEERLAAGDRSGVVKEFMIKQLGMPPAMVGVMRLLPTWSKLKKLAPTLPYDLKVMDGTQSGRPLPEGRWTGVSVPTLVLTGEKSDAFLRKAGESLAGLIPTAKHETLAGASHSAVVAAPKRLAKVLVDFWAQ
jgi:pimeloyl-ACP methyl ester carboxylesterase